MRLLSGRLTPAEAHMTYDEIAKELGMSRAAVQATELRALKKLRKQYPEMNDYFQILMEIKQDATEYL